MRRKILSDDEALQIFSRCCPGLFLLREVEAFQRFYCPIAIIEANVKEYVIDEYESVELLVLRLYAAGLCDADAICDLTGIDVHMVEKLLYAERYTYGHINPFTGELTEAGKKTLEENLDSDNLLQHAYYNTKRELQADAITGTIIKAEMELSKAEMPFYSDMIEPSIIPLNSVTIDSELEREIHERLQFYIAMDYIKDGSTVKDIEKMYTKEIRYRSMYYVKLSGFQNPFLAVPYDLMKNGKTETRIMPLSISLSDMDNSFFEETGQDYLFRRDEYFCYLNEVSNRFSCCSRPESEKESLIMEVGRDPIEEIVEDEYESDGENE